MYCFLLEICAEHFFHSHGIFQTVISVGVTKTHVKMETKFEAILRIRHDTIIKKPKKSKLRSADFNFTSRFFDYFTVESHVPKLFYARRWYSIFESNGVRQQT